MLELPGEGGCSPSGRHEEAERCAMGVCLAAFAGSECSPTKGAEAVLSSGKPPSRQSAEAAAPEGPGESGTVPYKQQREAEQQAA